MISQHEVFGTALKTFIANPTGRSRDKIQLNPGDRVKLPKPYAEDLSRLGLFRIDTSVENKQALPPENRMNLPAEAKVRVDAIAVAGSDDPDPDPETDSVDVRLSSEKPIRIRNGVRRSS